MKKQTTVYICDDCYEEFSKPLLSYILKYKSLDKDVDKEVDLCQECVKSRLSHSFSIVEDRLCKTCKGEGKVKEFYYHNEYNMIKCEKCDGKGVISLQ